MIFVNSDLKTFITGSCNGKNFRVPFTQEMYDKLKQLQEKSKDVKTIQEFNKIAEDFNSIVASFDYNTQLNNLTEGVVYSGKTGKYHLVINSKVYENVHIPEKLVQIIKDNVERNIESTPIINLCLRFLLNPKPTQERLNKLTNYITQVWVDENECERLQQEKGLSYSIAKEMATYSDLQITQEGYLKTSKIVDEITKKWSIKLDTSGKPVIENGKPVKELVDAYTKSYTINEETGVVTEEVTYPEFLEDRKFMPAIYKNGDEFYSGAELGYKYQIGKRAWLDSWDKVDMRDEVYHQEGLHTGGLRYVQNYFGNKRILLDVFVCPSMIGKFTDEGIGEMTAKEFFIYGSAMLGTNLRGLYHTSTYTAILKEELIKMLEAKFKDVSKNVSDFTEAQATAASIIDKVS